LFYFSLIFEPLFPGNDLNIGLVLKLYEFLDFVIEFRFFLDVEIEGLAQVVEVPLAMNAFEYENRVLALYEMLHRFGLLLGKYDDLELLWESQRYPVS